jgi:small subunit ribosomal protein S21
LTAFFLFPKVLFLMSLEIKLRKGESIDRALRRMKRKIERESIIRDARTKRYYEKPCEVRRRKAKVAAFSLYLKRKHEDV